MRPFSFHQRRYPRDTRPQYDHNGSIQEEISDDRIFVGGFGIRITENDLLEFFTQFGEVKHIRIIHNRDGFSKGYGFITFSSKEVAQKLLQSDHKSDLELKGRHIYLGTARVYYRGFRYKPQCKHEEQDSKAGDSSQVSVNDKDSSKYEPGSSDHFLHSDALSSEADIHSSPISLSPTGSSIPTSSSPYVQTSSPPQVQVESMPKYQLLSTSYLLKDLNTGQLISTCTVPLGTQPNPTNTVYPTFLPSVNSLTAQVPLYVSPVSVRNPELGKNPNNGDFHSALANTHVASCAYEESLKQSLQECMIVDMTNLNSQGYQTIQSSVQLNQASNVNIPSSQKFSCPPPPAQASCVHSPHVAQSSNVKYDNGGNGNIHHSCAPCCTNSEDQSKLNGNVESKSCSKKREKKGRRYFDKCKEKSQS